MTRDLEYYRNLLDKAVAGLRRLTPNFEKSSVGGKMLSDNIVCYREVICKEIATATPAFSSHHLISQQPSTLRQDPPPAKRSHLIESSDDG